MSFKYTINPEWNIIKDIREAVEKDPEIIARGKDFLDATRMVAIELAENALKYSDRGHPVELSMDIVDGEVIIQVRNHCAAPEMREALQAGLRKLGMGDPFDLYVERLQQLKDNPDGFSRMGLLRIAYEAEYKLEGEVGNDGEVLLRARRPIAA